jgi:hypothetical protein
MDQLASIPKEACAGFSVAQISAIGYTSVRGFSADQFENIPAKSCYGFVSGQISALAESTAPGVSADCLAQLSSFESPPNTLSLLGGGCRGLRPEFIAAMSLETFGGFTAECINKTDPLAFRNISPAQMAAFKPASCNGFYEDHVIDFSATSASGLQKECLEQFSFDIRWPACKGFQWPFVQQMTPVTFQGFSLDCLATTNWMFFLGVNASQIAHIPAASFAGLNFQVPDISLDAWQGTSLEQLQQLSTDGFSGIQVEGLAMLLSKFKLDLVNGWTTEQTSQYPSEAATGFKELIPSQMSYLTEWKVVSTDLPKATWLKIALLTPTEQAIFDEKTIPQLPPSAVQGFRTDHVILITAANFKLFSGYQSQYFTNDTTAVFSASQLSNLTPEAFQNINSQGIRGLKPNIIPAITADQMKVLTIDQINVLQCAQLHKFSASQLGQFDADQKESFDARIKKECNVVSPSSAPADSPFVKEPVGSPSANSSPNSWLTDNMLLIIGGACLVAVVAVGSIVFVVVRKRGKAAKEFTEDRKPLLTQRD